MFPDLTRFGRCEQEEAGQMSNLSAQLLVLPHASCLDSSYRPLDELFEPIELLVPEVAHFAERNVQTYALAFAARYKRDVLQLEHAWRLLYAAIVQSWRQQRYEDVVLLADTLVYPAGRRCTLSEAEQLLRLGIEASRRLQDTRTMARFFNRLGGLLFSHGRYWQGRQVWSASLRLPAAPGTSLALWEPLASFAYIADILGNYSYAQQFVEALLSTGGIDDPASIAVATFIRGFYARHMHEPGHAYEDFCCALRLLSSCETNAAAPSDRQIFTLVVQTELARLEGHYERAKGFAEAALSLARVYSDPYTVAVLLFDQGLYAYQQGQRCDIVGLSSSLQDIATELHVPHIHALSHYLNQFVAHLPSPRERSALLLTPDLYESLSKRELEVLTLAGEGLSNQGIASRLVISRGTVKKHLEHIYSKLHVHNRSSAIARARKSGMLPLN
jgi:DNA-binding CsgD family transcriptional regulator